MKKNVLSIFVFCYGIMFSLAGIAFSPVADLWQCESSEIAIKSTSTLLSGSLSKEVAQVIYVVTIKKDPEIFPSSENHYFIDPVGYSGDDGYRYTISGSSTKGRAITLGIGDVRLEQGRKTGNAWLKIVVPVSYDDKTGKAVTNERSFEGLRCK